MPRKASDQELAAFVAENLTHSPLAQRSGLCRRIAELVIDRDIATRLLAQADSLDDIAEDHAQLLLNLRGGAR
jgi:hypothetical protein